LRIALFPYCYVGGERGSKNFRGAIQEAQANQESNRPLFLTNPYERRIRQLERSSIGLVNNQFQRRNLAIAVLKKGQQQ
jgi:hypothetical protein